MTVRCILALPSLVGVLALGDAAGARALSLALGCVVLVLALIGPRLELDLGRDLLTSAIAAGVGFMTASLLHDPVPGRLSEGWAQLAAAAFLGAAARSVIVGARGGYSPVLALSFVGMVASGKTQGSSYALWVVGYFLTTGWALAQRPGRVASRARARRAAWAALLLIVAGSLGVGSTLGLRRLHAWASQRQRLTTYRWRPQVGFSDRMDLGALDGLLDSEQRVLRLRGPRVDYLRGVVLDVYQVGRWEKSEAAEQQAELTFGGEPPAGDVVEIAAVQERTGLFFLPLHTQQLLTTPATVLVDDLGSIQRNARRGLVSARFLPGRRERARLTPARAVDLQLPRRLRARIEALAAEWTAGADTPLEKLTAIERRLRSDYQYARAFTRPNGVDPVMDFLFDDPRGHCEYFATALALVARGAGVSTRVVMGYRVAERSPFGYHVVRERNAHAWVEAWLPGSGWITRDATPEAELPQNRQHVAGYAASSLDALGVFYDDATDWLGRLSLAQTSLAWAVGSLLLAGIVARGARRRRRRASTPPDQAALPFLEPLLAQLSRSGHERGDAETLEHLAARLPEAAPARLLLRYAAFRYGGSGDPLQLARDVADYRRSRRRVAGKSGRRG